MQPICTYPRVARSTASPAHEANGWSLLDLPRQASLQPRWLATHHSGQDSFSDPRLFHPRDMYAVAALSTASASSKTNPSRSAKATKLFEAPRYVRRVLSRTEISSSIDWTRDTVLASIESIGAAMGCSNVFFDVRWSARFVLSTDAVWFCRGVVELPLLSQGSRRSVVVVVFLSPRHSAGYFLSAFGTTLGCLSSSCVKSMRTARPMVALAQDSLSRGRGKRWTVCESSHASSCLLTVPTLPMYSAGSSRAAPLHRFELPGNPSCSQSDAVVQMPLTLCIRSLQLFERRRDTAHTTGRLSLSISRRVMSTLSQICPADRGAGPELPVSQCFPDISNCSSSARATIGW